MCEIIDVSKIEVSKNAPYFAFTINKQNTIEMKLTEPTGAGINTSLVSPNGAKVSIKHRTNAVNNMLKLNFIATEIGKF